MFELTSRKLALFQEQGFLLLEAFLPDDLLASVITDIQEGIARGALASFEEGKITQAVEGESFERRLALIEQENGGNSRAGRYVLGKNLKTAGMFGLMTYPPLLDTVESLIGPEILSHPQFNTQAKMSNDSAVSPCLPPLPIRCLLESVGNSLFDPSAVFSNPWSFRLHSCPSACICGSFLLFWLCTKPKTGRLIAPRHGEKAEILRRQFGGVLPSIQGLPARSFTESEELRVAIEGFFHRKIK